MIRCASSLRAVPPATTLERACRWGVALGVTRVTEITRLDRIGIPVCVAVRPGARPGSLCVSAGKGLTVLEARVGAWMEAIEFALAEPRAAEMEVHEATARDVLDGHTRPDAILDFCPVLTAEIPLDAPLPCVAADELVSGAQALVPAEIVFLPPDSRAPSRYFTAGSNGLASGNTLLEATVHGLAELIERDICAFHSLRDRSVSVRIASLPPPASDLAAAVHEASLRLIVRHLPNEFGLPCFSALMIDREAHSPCFVNGGFGCHPHRDIALVRAICEAAQSRLSVIHGGRDDLTDQARRFRGRDETRQQDYWSRACAMSATREREIDADAVVDRAGEAQNLSSAYEVLAESLLRAGMGLICRIALTRPGDELQVVRIVAPGLEEFNAFTPRVGRRLRDHVSRAAS